VHAESAGASDATHDAAPEAETLAKTALLRGPHAGRRVPERHGGGALILDDGQPPLVGELASTPERSVAA
jgi:hypothetical protein